MSSLHAKLLCSGALILTFLGSVQAQDAAPATEAPTAGPSEAAEAGSQGDSGTSLVDEARSWIGQNVVSADGTEIGTLTGVTDVVSDSSEAGQLVVETADGSEIQMELQGASSDGETVTVVEPAVNYEEEIDASQDEVQGSVGGDQNKFEATLAGHAILPAETLISPPRRCARGA